MMSSNHWRCGSDKVVYGWCVDERGRAICKLPVATLVAGLADARINVEADY
ncbi:hypothetical protein KCP73_15075 [Salmonella enterica subsp. enterica]|nr:hypothetical protein KCP73_15075 [Salmonella enterica subsp. enterica]